MESGGIIFQFNRQGKFIRKINRHGQGPGECYARDTGIDEKSRLIYIFDNWTLSINVFDFDGKYIKTIKNPFKNDPDGLSPSHMGCDSKGNILFTFGNERGNMKYKYVVASSELEILYKCPNYDRYELKEKGRGTPGFVMYPYPIYEYNSCNYYPPVYNDTIFRIDDDYSCSPARIIHIPNRVTLEENLKKSANIIEYAALNGKNALDGILENKQHIYVYHYCQLSENEFRIFLSLFNKRTGQLTENINPLIVNDWDCGFDVKFATNKQKENVVYELLQPFKMKEKLTDSHFSTVQAKYPEAQQALYELVDNMQEDDNPVIMILTLK